MKESKTFTADHARGPRVALDAFVIGEGQPLCLIAGPCVVESEALAVRVAREAKQACHTLGVNYIFKSSFDKANRTSARSYRGRGMERGLAVLAAVRKEVGVPVLTDVHEVRQVGRVADVVDVIQIPAFLCRQTDLLREAGRTGKVLNIKKGQFLSPWDMRHVVEKVRKVGNRRILLTERGTTFGYGRLVTDLRSLLVMRALGCPVVFDASHSLQEPGGLGHASGGDRRYIPAMARAAAAVGMDGLFIETHPNPDRALSDGPTSLPLKELGTVLREVTKVRRVLAQR